MKKNLLLSIFTFFLITSLPSCSGGKFVFVTTYSQTAVDQLNSVSAKVNFLYSNIAKSEDKSFDTYKSQYDEIASLLTALKTYEDNRPKNKAIAYQAATALSLFTTYMNEHQAKGSITAAVANVYASYMRSAFNPWKASEKALNK